MRGLVPRIHVFQTRDPAAWMTGTSPVMTTTALKKTVDEALKAVKALKQQVVAADKDGYATGDLKENLDGRIDEMLDRLNELKNEGLRRVTTHASPRQMAACLVPEGQCAAAAVSDPAGRGAHPFADERLVVLRRHRLCRH
jgi:hypothetical protein